MTEQKSSITTESKSGCSQAQRLLPGYLRHELTAVQHHQIQTHLAHCNRCAQLVHEARLLDADLQDEADRFQPRLSQAASLRVQRQLYRRMRRSLVWQRTGQVVRLGMAAATLLMLLAGSFLFGRFWLPFLTSATEDTSIVAGETTTEPEAPMPEPTAVPTTPPARPEPKPATPPGESVRSGRLNASDSWVSAAPGQTPEQLAATITTAALAQESAYLGNLLIGLGAAQQPTVQTWLRLGSRCPQSEAIAHFEFTRRPISLTTMTAVDIWYNHYWVGEIKMRQVRGDWFATFTRIPAINSCLYD